MIRADEIEGKRRAELLIPGERGRTYRTGRDIMQFRATDLIQLLFWACGCLQVTCVATIVPPGQTRWVGVSAVVWSDD